MKLTLVCTALLATLLGLMASEAGAEEMSNETYMYKLQEIIEDEAIWHTKYPWITYLMYCEYTKTPGGFWRCQESLDRDGIPDLGCSKPEYGWTHADGIENAVSKGWKRAPLRFHEDINNEPYAPMIFWFYKCKEVKP